MANTFTSKDFIVKHKANIDSICVSIMYTGGNLDCDIKVSISIKKTDAICEDCNKVETFLCTSDNEEGKMTIMFTPDIPADRLLDFYKAYDNISNPEKFQYAIRTKYYYQKGENTIDKFIKLFTDGILRDERIVYSPPEENA